MNERECAVDGVEDPLNGCVFSDSAEFLAEDAVARETRLNLIAHELFCFLVGDGDGGVIRLRRDLQIRVEILQGVVAASSCDFSGRAEELCEVGCHVWECIVQALEFKVQNRPGWPDYPA